MRRPRLRLPRPGSNPVLRRELLARWRGRRAFLVLSLYLTVVALVVVLLYLVGSNAMEGRGNFDVADPGPTIGRFLFENLLALVLLLVLFIGPGYAAAQVVGERERQTLGLLQVTLVRPRSLVLGKLGASVAWLLLLVVATLPFMAAAFFLGGIAPGELARGLVFVLVVAISTAGIALGISAVVRSTTAAVVTTYGLVLVLTLGTLFAALLEYTVLDWVDQFDDRSAVSMYANPYLGLTDAVRARNSNDVPSVLAPFVEALPGPNRRRGGGDVNLAPFAEPNRFDEEFVEFADDQPLVREVAGGGGDRQPVWMITGGLYLLMGALGVAVATRRVAVPRGGRFRRGGRRGRGQGPDDGGSAIDNPAPTLHTEYASTAAVDAAPDATGGDR